MKQEINSLKRQVKFYKEKLQLELVTSIKKTDLLIKTNKKVNKGNNTKNSMNNSITEGKAKTDLLQDINNIKINENLDDTSGKDNQSDKQDENGITIANVTIDKIPSFHSNEKAPQQNSNNIIPERKRLNVKREKIKSINFSPKFNKIVSKSPHKNIFSKEQVTASKYPNSNINFINNNNFDKTKMNLTKYLNDGRGSNEKLPYTTVKPDIPHTSKNNRNLNINKINDMINTSKNKVNLGSPKNTLKKDDENDKEVFSFLGNLAAKFDEELENLTEIENMLINSKLDLKCQNNNDMKSSENDVNNSIFLDNKNNFLSLTHDNSNHDLINNKGKAQLGKFNKNEKNTLGKKK